MRLLVLSIGTLLTLVLGIAWAQTPTGSGTTAQIPYGQTFKNFQFPHYQDGELKATLSAVSAKGTTINRAEATELKIELYDQGKVTTTVTSPKADLYLAELRMRTKNTVQIERADMEASAQTCDFDLVTKKYTLRENVKVTLKNFDSNFKSHSGSLSPTSSPGAITPPTHTVPTHAPLTLTPNPSQDNSLLDTPGAYANTNPAPTFPKNSVNP